MQLNKINNFPSLTVKWEELAKLQVFLNYCHLIRSLKIMEWCRTITMLWKTENCSDPFSPIKHILNAVARKQRSSKSSKNKAEKLECWNFMSLPHQQDETITFPQKQTTISALYKMCLCVWWIQTWIKPQASWCNAIRIM